MDLYSSLIQNATKNGIERFTVGAVILNKNEEILLLKRKKDDFMGGIYEIPGGKVENGETILDTLKREVLEETNFELSSVCKYIDYFDYYSSERKNCRQFNFLVDANIDGEPILSEHSHYHWVAAKMVFNLDIVSPELAHTLNIFYFNEVD